MRPIRNLTVLESCAYHRLDQLHKLAASLPLLAPEDRRRAAAFGVIELANCWAGFARSYYISCILRARRGGGGRVSVGVPGVATPQDAIHEAVRIIAPRRLSKSRRYHATAEPSWYKRETLLDLGNGLRLSNDPQIQLAMNLPTDAFTDLLVFRHFFAHRGEGTVKQVKVLAPRYGQPSTAAPADVVAGFAPGRPQNVLADWIDDIRITVAYLCQ
jgi:hypothetical protein